MSKERTSVSLDPDVAAYLSREGVNASQLVNKLVKQHMAGGASESEIRQFRIKQLESEYEELASRARLKIEELNEIRERERSESQELESWLTKFEAMLNDGTHVFAGHGKVKQAANECGVSPMEMIERLQSRNDELPDEMFKPQNID